MARSVHQIPLEKFVEGYLKKISKTSNKSGELKFLEKAIALIEQELGYPCCLTNTAVYTQITPHDNQLTIMIKAAITNNDIIRRGFLMSLKRILNILNIYLYGCCTQIVTVTFDGTVPPSSVGMRLIDLITGTVILQTATSGLTQTFNISAKYFGPEAFVQVCIIDTVDPGVHTNQIKYGATILVASSDIGLTCGITQPVIAAYTVTQIA